MRNRRRRQVLKRLALRAAAFTLGALGSWLVTAEAIELLGPEKAALVGGAVAAVLYDLKDAR